MEAKNIEPHTGAFYKTANAVLMPSDDFQVMILLKKNESSHRLFEIQYTVENDIRIVEMDCFNCRSIIAFNQHLGDVLIMRRLKSSNDLCSAHRICYAIYSQ